MNYLESERYRRICEAEQEALFAIRFSVFSIVLSVVALILALMENL